MDLAPAAVFGHIFEQELHVCEPVPEGLAAAESDYDGLGCVVTGDDPCCIGVLGAVGLEELWLVRDILEGQQDKWIIRTHRTRRLLLHYSPEQLGKHPPCKKLSGQVYSWDRNMLLPKTRRSR